MQRTALSLKSFMANTQILVRRPTPEAVMGNRVREYAVGVAVAIVMTGGLLVLLNHMWS
jgi:hypothetical protein